MTVAPPVVAATADVSYASSSRSSKPASSNWPPATSPPTSLTTVLRPNRLPHAVRSPPRSRRQRCPANRPSVGTHSRGNVCRTPALKTHLECVSKARILAVSRTLAMRNQGLPFPQSQD